MDRSYSGSSPMRPALREIAELQQAIDQFRLHGVGSEDNDELDEDEDDALQTKTPIARPRAAPWNTSKPRKRLPRPPPAPSWQKDLPLVNQGVPPRLAPAPYSTTVSSRSDSNSAIVSHGSPSSTSYQYNYDPPLPSKSPLRLHLDQEPPSPRRVHQNFSHRLNTPQNLQVPPPPTQTAPSQHPRGLHSYSKHAKATQNLRRWSSLETIHSVHAAQSIREEDIQEDENDALDYTLECALDGTLDDIWDDTASTSTADSRRRFMVLCDDVGEEGEDWVQAHAANTPVQSHWTSKSPRRHLNPNSPTSTQSSLRNLQMEESLYSRTNSDTSNMTISSGKPSDDVRPTSSAASTSQNSASSKDWKSSEFDTSGLTESELKKCKKKGINPALYAEMKAARKGKHISPIGGNTFI